MDSTHIHLLLNHFPILGSLFGLCLMAYGLWRKNQSIEHAGFMTLIIIALITIPVYITGEEAEETVEHLQGVSEHFIEEHEELAELGIILMEVTGIFALFTLIVSTIKKRRNITFSIITLILTIVTFAVMCLVGNHGGKIRHSEIRNDNNQSMERHIDKE